VRGVPWGCNLLSGCVGTFFMIKKLMYRRIISWLGSGSVAFGFGHGHAPVAAASMCR
jgi:hypothetical protein